MLTKREYESKDEIPEVIEANLQAVQNNIDKYSNFFESLAHVTVVDLLAFTHYCDLQIAELENIYYECPDDETFKNAYDWAESDELKGALFEINRINIEIPKIVDDLVKLKIEAVKKLQ
jgi:hypothetical protein